MTDKLKEYYKEAGLKNFAYFKDTEFFGYVYGANYRIYLVSTMGQDYIWIVNTSVKNGEHIPVFKAGMESRVSTMEFLKGLGLE